MNDLEKYFEDSFGFQMAIVSLSKEDKAMLPLYLKAFPLYSSELFGKKFLWIIQSSDNKGTPDQLLKQAEQLEAILQRSAIFVFKKLDSWERKRLIEKRIAFAEPFRQLYIPALMLLLNDGQRSDKTEEKTNMNLTWPAQCALLYHLQVASLENKTFQEIAGILDYSSMTVTRIMKELLRFDMIEIAGAKEKSAQFKQEGKQLWLVAVEYLRSPVRESWFLDDLQDFHLQRAGDTALSDYGMLSPGKVSSYAIGKDAFRNLNKKLFGSFGDNRIEVWHYNPEILSKGKAVDKLSLYLTMQNETDERVKAALEDLINEIQW